MLAGVVIQDVALYDGCKTVKSYIVPVTEHRYECKGVR